MTVLTIPPTRPEDIDQAKDFLFKAFGEKRWTEGAYLQLSDGYNRLIELSEGRLVVPAMPTPEHQDIVWRIGEALKAWARKHGGRAFVAPLPVRLWAGKFREPDALLYSVEHRDRVEQQYGGPPDLVVEVLSPGTEDIDTDDKVTEYAQAGIPEYWIVDSNSPRVEQYVIKGQRYRRHARLSAGHMLRAVTLPDLAISLDSLYTRE